MKLKWLKIEPQDAITEKWCCGRYTLAHVGATGKYMMALGTWNLGEYANPEEAMKRIARTQSKAHRDFVYPPSQLPIFTFGSNLAGRHGKGAALWARNNHGANQGQAEGFMGNSYAIPTRNRYFKNLPLEVVKEGLQRWAEFTQLNPAMHFILTPIGCGLAENDPQAIKSIVQGLGLKHNVSLSMSWWDHV
jgi:hypothetical protein